VKVFISALFLLSSFLSIGSKVDYLPVPTGDLVKHKYYSLSYNERYEQANWVYYSLTDSMILNSSEERTNKFKADPSVSTGSAKPSDYTKSGYDRGHLCPAGDMGFNATAMQESFLMSNMSPQVPEFNRGIWKELETIVREWAKKEHHIFVVTGPVFKNLKGSVGLQQVIVPGYFFKVIYNSGELPKMIAFILPNTKSDRPLTDFAVSADEVEQQTGLDFFPQLPDELESKLEAKTDLSGWFEGYSTPAQVPDKPKVVTPESDFSFYLILFGVIAVVILFVAIRNLMKRK
jgi:endonuclease G